MFKNPIFNTVPITMLVNNFFEKSMKSRPLRVVATSLGTLVVGLLVAVLLSERLLVLLPLMIVVCFYGTFISITEQKFP